ncbi:glycoside hydrolase superfamily [Lipomyces tetrasporus]|uniref:Glycoside hydrolase superfamily n=1 Tax=Lipomyces tetrasporus TaxID=54092 RepID=A0AAD7QLZ6_9ASCO|nr:glycoside hydrolase superfamily [Lipomyces tetrasporus]KAJ8097648.1 glycoside hydrolase superfamily [Lipomyces tetrasporus]
MTKEWWKEGVVYQIYPSSFKDSNGDGIGDIPGITSELDYIKSLGVDIIWVSPFYKSPQYDMGYDISDYQDVYEQYGTVEDVDALIQGCHDRGMRIIFDLVVNHTSHLHPWFQESASSKNNPKHDWYIWRPARYINGERHPPCNWRGFFGGSVWEWDDNIGEYYLHLFAKEQPDLNWDNPDVRQAIYNDAMRFWLDKGVDGFRIDTVNMYSKRLDFPDAPVVEPDTPWQPAYDLICNGPRMHEFLREMNYEVLSKYDAMTVGELPHTPDPAHVLGYISASACQLQQVFQMDLVFLDFGERSKYYPRKWALTEFKEALEKWQCFIEGNDGWTTNFLENHDTGRSVSRYGSDDPRFAALSAKMLAVLLTTLTGTTYVYQGQEIGMVNAPKTWPIEEYKDIETLNYYNEVKQITGGDKVALEEVMRGIQLTARDHNRLPFQWNANANAGFTSSAKSWMRVHDNYGVVNATQQSEDPSSVLSFWKSMIRLRKQYSELFVHGSFTICDFENEAVLSYVKEETNKRALVVLNFTDKPQELNLKLVKDMTVLVSNYSGKSMEPVLKPFEGRIYI